jgi:serine/threonine protein kinase
MARVVPALPALDPSVGKAVGGTDWIFERTLGRGGMGVVLAVVKPIAGIAGAMKLPHAELSACVGVRARFLEEARLCAALKHPHVVGVLDAGFLDSGVPFLVMERLRGRTLRDEMHAGFAGTGIRACTAFEIIASV